MLQLNFQTAKMLREIYFDKILKMQQDRIYELDFIPTEENKKFENWYLQYRKQIEELLGEYFHLRKEPESYRVKILKMSRIFFPKNAYKNV